MGPGEDSNAKRGELDMRYEIGLLMGSIVVRRRKRREHVDEEVDDRQQL